MSQGDMTRPTVPWWASRPTKDVITICLMVATGMACGLFMARSQRDWVCETTLGAGALGTVVDMTENGALAAVARPDGRITVHDLARHGVVQELQAESGAPSAVAVSVDGQHMAVGFPDAPVKLWPPNTRAKPVALGEGTSGAVGLAFSGDGRRLACYTSDDLLSVWQVPVGERLSASRFSGVGEAKYVRLRFSDEEKAVVVFPLWAGSTAMDGLEIETGNRVRFYGEESGGNGKGVAFPTTLVDYTSRWYKLEGQLPNGHEVAFAGMVMKPWGRGSRPRGQSTLFQLAPGHVLGGGHNAIAFDAEADRAVYASADERVYQMRQAEAGEWRQGAIPWVALGFAVALVVWLILAWRPASRYVRADMAAVAQAAARLTGTDRRLRLDLLILAFVVAADGAVTLGSMAVGVFYDRLDLRLAVLNLFAAGGLLKFKRGWRLFVLFQLWCLFFLTGLLSTMFLAPGASPVLWFLGGSAIHVPQALVWAGPAALFAIGCWAFWVLTRWRTRLLFCQPPAAPDGTSPAQKDA